MEYSYFPPDFRLKYSNDFVDYKEKFVLFNNVCRPGMKHTAWCCANVCHVTLESLSKLKTKATATTTPENNDMIFE